MACLFFLFLVVFFKVQRILIFMKISLSVLYLMDCAFVLHLKSCHHIYECLHCLFLLLPSRSTLVLGFIFRAVIHFELIFVKGVKSMSTIHSVSIHWQDHPSFSIGLYLFFCQRNVLSMFVWICFRILYSDPLI